MFIDIKKFCAFQMLITHNIAGFQGLSAARVLARAGVAGPDLAVLLGVRPSRVVRTVTDAASRRLASGQRRHLRRVLRAVHRRAAGQYATVLDGRRGARLAGLVPALRLVGQPFQRPKCQGQGLALLVAELGQQRGQMRASMSQRFAVLHQTLRGDLHQNGPQIRRIAGTLDQAELLQSPDGDRRRRCAHPLTGRELRHPDRARIEQGEQDRQLGQREIATGGAAGIAAA